MLPISYSGAKVTRKATPRQSMGRGRPQVRGNGAEISPDVGNFWHLGAGLTTPAGRPGRPEGPAKVRGRAIQAPAGGVGVKRASPVAGVQQLEETRRRRAQRPVARDQASAASSPPRR